MSACDDYRIDMTAATFGACKCGQPKSAHNLTNKGPASPSPKKLVSVFVPKAEGEAESSGDGACSNYRVDMAAAAFGQCKCGHPKAAHAVTASPSMSKMAQAKAAQKAADEAKAAADAKVGILGKISVRYRAHVSASSRNGKSFFFGGGLLPR